MVGYIVAGIIGLFVGAFIGCMCACLVIACKNNDDYYIDEIDKECGSNENR